MLHGAQTMRSVINDIDRDVKVMGAAYVVDQKVDKRGSDPIEI